MDMIYSLIPGMTFFGLLMVGVLIWTVRKGQYEDMEGNASRILHDDDEDAMLASLPRNKKESQQEEAPREPKQ
mgnify:CR=1 FL=1